MKRQHQLKNDSGNAVIEFVAIGLIAQLIIFSFVIRLGIDFRSNLAATSIARQTLRAFQLTGSDTEAFNIANQVIQVFGFQANDARVAIQNLCAQQSLIVVEATVRGKAHVAKGICSF